MTLRIVVRIGRYPDSKAHGIEQMQFKFRSPWLAAVATAYRRQERPDMAFGGIIPMQKQKRGT